MIVLNDDRLAQAQAHIDAIKAKAEDDLSALRDAAASAKERVASGVADLRAQVEPLSAEPAIPDFDPDNAPTIEVDMPADLSFDDLDPGAPSTPIEEIAATQDAAPAVRFDPENETATDDDGIPIWEDPA